MYQFYRSIPFCWDFLGELLSSSPRDWLKWWHGAVCRIPSWNSPALISPWSSNPNAVHLHTQYKEWMIIWKPSDPQEPPWHWPFVEISWCFHLNPRGTSHSMPFLYALLWLDWPWILISVSTLLFSHSLATEKSRLLSVTQITPFTDIHLWEVQKRIKKAQVGFFLNPQISKGNCLTLLSPSSASALQPKEDDAEK